jgi:hypothetical protein
MEPHTHGVSLFHTSQKELDILKPFSIGSDPDLSKRTKFYLDIDPNTISNISEVIITLICYMGRKDCQLQTITLKLHHLDLFDIYSLIKATPNQLQSLYLRLTRQTINDHKTQQLIGLLESKRRHNDIRIIGLGETLTNYVNDYMARKDVIEQIIIDNNRHQIKP